MAKQILISKGRNFGKTADAISAIKEQIKNSEYRPTMINYQGKWFDMADEAQKKELKRLIR